MGKTYAICDIHSHLAPLDRFLSELEEDDKVYVIGDLADKGPDGLEPFLRILDDERCVFIAGNHDLMMLERLHCSRNGINDRMAEEERIIWEFRNDGMRTMRAWEQLDPEDQERIFRSLEEAPLLLNVSVEGRDFVLVHAFPFQDLYEYWSTDLMEPLPDRYVKEIFDGIHYDWRSDLIWERREAQLPGRIVVTGHTPVQSFGSWDEAAEILIRGDWYDIDCGMAIDQEGVSRLAALCLNDLTVRYYDL